MIIIRALAMLLGLICLILAIFGVGVGRGGRFDLGMVGMTLCLFAIGEPLLSPISP
jgi:hypothetical protein